MHCIKKRVELYSRVGRVLNEVLAADDETRGSTKVALYSGMSLSSLLRPPTHICHHHQTLTDFFIIGCGLPKLLSYLDPPQNV